MHTTGVIVASLSMTVASVIGITIPSLRVGMVLIVGVAFIGIPHGSLDHLTGRNLLSRQFPKSWSFIFFAAYLAVALIVVLGWYAFPVITAVGFFMISAWHFGLEDERRQLNGGPSEHLFAIAIGGLAIWIPMLSQPERIRSILAEIIPADLVAAADTAVSLTVGISWILLPIVAIVLTRDLLEGQFSRVIRNLSFIAMFAFVDVLISFGVYFCLWHSVRGLRRLADEFAMTPAQLAVAAIPMTLGAFLLAALGGFYWSNGQAFTAATNRTLFLALSALAVPHLLLHGPVTQMWAKLKEPHHQNSKGIEVAS